MLKTVIETSFRQRINALRAHFFAQVVAQVAIHRRENLLQIFESERNSLDVHRRHHRADQPAIQRKEVELAVNQHGQHRGIAARSVIVFRECLYIDASVCFVLYRVPHRQQGFMQRAFGGLIVELPHRKFRRSDACPKQRGAARDDQSPVKIAS